MLVVFEIIVCVVVLYVQLPFDGKFDMKVAAAIVQGARPVRFGRFPRFCCSFHHPPFLLHLHALCVFRCHQAIPSSETPELAGLIAACWDQEPSKRPSFTQILHVLQETKKRGYVMTCVVFCVVVVECARVLSV